MSGTKDNPFAALFGASNTATSNSDNGETFNDSEKGFEQLRTVNSIVESVFHITINPNVVNDLAKSNKQLVFMEELAETMKPNIFIDLETLEQALFERLLLTKPELYVIPKTGRAPLDHVVQNKVFPYLFDAMQNMEGFANSNNPIAKVITKRVTELIFRNAVTALKQPILFEGQDFSVQLVDLLKCVDPNSHTFFEDIVNAFMSDSEYFSQFILLLNKVCAPFKFSIFLTSR